VLEEMMRIDFVYGVAPDLLKDFEDVPDNVYAFIIDRVYPD
jgi:hypothetical protein